MRTSKAARRRSTSGSTTTSCCHLIRCSSDSACLFGGNATGRPTSEGSADLFLEEETSFSFASILGFSLIDLSMSSGLRLCFAKNFALAASSLHLAKEALKVRCLASSVPAGGHRFVLVPLRSFETAGVTGAFGRRENLVEKLCDLS